MNCQSNFKHKEPSGPAEMNALAGPCPLGWHLYSLTSRKSATVCVLPKFLSKTAAEPKGHIHWQALFPVTMLHKSFVKPIGKQMWIQSSAHTFSRTSHRQEESPVAHWSQQLSPHTSALDRGYLILPGKLQKGFSDLTVKCLDSEGLCCQTS